MTKSSSSIVESNQLDVHPDLEVTVSKHLNSHFDKPYARYNQEQFIQLLELVEKSPRPIIFDSCCGVGESTINLAKQHPNHWVFGIDQSDKRTSKFKPNEVPDNARIIRADVIDIWRLAHAERWQLAKHYLLYPNPWPKKKHLQRRWHGHPVFRSLLGLKGELTLRTNWQLYAKEFADALECAGIYQYQLQHYVPNAPDKLLTPFERKYYQSDHQLYQLQADLN
jgi:tRNA (guanine-N7-)-methyltransferase